MTDPVIRYDDSVKALYVRLLDAEVEETIAISDSVYIDVTADGLLAGFEILGTDSPFLAALKDLPVEATVGDLLRLTVA